MMYRVMAVSIEYLRGCLLALGLNVSLRLSIACKATCMVFFSASARSFGIVCNNELSDALLLPNICFALLYFSMRSMYNCFRTGVAITKLNAASLDFSSGLVPKSARGAAT